MTRYLKKELLERFPTWYYDLKERPEQYYLILTDDADSFFACRLLRSITNGQLKVGGFYQPKSGLYLTNFASNMGREPVFVDASIARDGVKCIDNHRCPFSNSAAINPNVILPPNAKYNTKYPGSTLLLIASLYDVNIDRDDQIDILLAADSFYTAFYRRVYKSINIGWLKLLDLEEQLLKRIDTKDREYFDGVLKRYSMDGKIRIEPDNKLHWDRDGLLPTEDFHKVFSVICKIGTVQEAMSDKNVFSCAQIERDTCCYSVMSEEDILNEKQAS